MSQLPVFSANSSVNPKILFLHAGVKSSTQWLQQMSTHILKQTTDLPGAVREVYRCLTQHWNFKYARAYIPYPRQMTFIWISQ